MTPKAPNLRRRRAIAALATIVFLIAYVWAVVSFSTRLPDNPWLELIYYGVAGIAWGVPLFPLLAWAEGGAKKRR